MTKPTTAPYGEWDSPFPISLLTAGVVTLGEMRASDGVRWWLEGRPDESGRQVLVRREADGSQTRLTPEGLQRPDTRPRVRRRRLRSSTATSSSSPTSTTGRLNRVGHGRASSTPLTPERAWRFADLVVDRARNRLLAVREDHEPETLERHGEAENSLVAIDLDSRRGHGPRRGRRLLSPRPASRRTATSSPGSSGATRTCRGTGRSCGWPTSPRTGRSARPARSPAARPTGSPSRAGRRTASSTSSPSRTAG